MCSFSLSRIKTAGRGRGHLPPPKIETLTPGSQYLTDSDVLTNRLLPEAEKYEERERVDRKQIEWNRCRNVVMNVFRKLQYLTEILMGTLPRSIRHEVQILEGADHGE